MKVITVFKDQFAIISFKVDQILGYEVQEFQDAVLNSIDKGTKFIIVDLSGVKYISSWGIGMLIHGLATTKNRGGEFKIACLADKVFEVLQKVKINTVLDIHKSVDSAMSVR